ncbi:hypothetical protein G5B00_02160 [Parapedobacter sp. SGR-10]|uniref:hypothetical protein n=1 Tax=Parapedobacter sp. SGR-10 TaxID=2710879 RepID=UPI0013D7D2FA|nr:hypothetical protein [Parapedobacter sp. SGR-10]NGF55304.1 hypothetical protein [Parapedobacter sp. SGR-10]
MKKLILTGLGFLFAITLALAQEVDVEQKTKETIATLAEKLTLSDEQQATIYPVVLEAKITKYALKADTALSFQELQQQLHKLKEGSNNRIMEQLNDKQKEQFKKYLAERKSKED